MATWAAAERIRAARRGSPTGRLEVLAGSPHECAPAAAPEYYPSGAVACPHSLSPQQVMVPSVRTPHA